MALFFVLSFAFGEAHPVIAQEPLLILDGGHANDHLGKMEIDFAGDVNGDGYDDIVTGLSDWQTQDWKRFEVFSGFDGSLIHSWPFGSTVDISLAHSCSAAGDMDGDGLADVVLGGSTGAESFVEVRSGGNGQLIHRWTSNTAVSLGAEVRGRGDVDGDGVPDVLARENNNSSLARKVYVYSGATGQVLFAFDTESNPTEWSWGFGVAMDFLGDINGDGCDDFVVGDQDSDLGGTRSGAAFVFSGLDGEVLFQFPGYQIYSDYGSAVAGPGDMDGDGIPDIAIGAGPFDGIGKNSGLVQVFSGSDGSLIYQFEGEKESDGLGVKLSDAGDVNSDGRADLLIFGERDPSFNVLCRVFSGLDGSVLMTQRGTGLESYGYSIAGGDDLNGDGFPDFAVSAPEYGNHAGRIYVYPGNPVLKVDPLTAGQMSEFQVSHFASNKLAGLAYSLVGLGVVPVPQLGLYLDILRPVPVAGPSTTDSQGWVSWPLNVPAGASGITIWIQAAQNGLKTNVVSRTIQ